MIHGRDEKWWQSDRFISIAALAIQAGIWYECYHLAIYIIGSYL